jgi:hypothetical protein
LTHFRLTSIVIFDSVAFETKEVVQMSDQIIAHLKSFQERTVAQFSFDYGPIIPLYFVGLNHRNGPIRKEAIQMLYATTTNEDACNTLFVAKSADWVRQVEEVSIDLETGRIPEWARIGYLPYLNTNLNVTSRTTDLASKP